MRLIHCAIALLAMLVALPFASAADQPNITVFLVDDWA